MRSNVLFDSVAEREHSIQLKGGFQPGWPFSLLDNADIGRPLSAIGGPAAMKEQSNFR